MLFKKNQKIFLKIKKNHNFVSRLQLSILKMIEVLEDLILKRCISKMLKAHQKNIHLKHLKKEKENQ